VSFVDATAALREFQREAERVEAARARMSAEEARPLNRWLMRTRKALIPWLYAQGPTGSRVSPYATTFATLGRARASAARGDRAATIDALGQLSGVRVGAQVSPEVTQGERLFWYSGDDWSTAYEQKERPIGYVADELYRRLMAGGDSGAEAAALGQLEEQARGRLIEALFIVTGKLRSATAALRQAPLPESSGTSTRPVE
jgi:hypothetical protein